MEKLIDRIKPHITDFYIVRDTDFYSDFHFTYKGIKYVYSHHKLLNHHYLVKKDNDNNYVNSYFFDELGTFNTNSIIPIEIEVDILTVESFLKFIK